MNRTKQVWINFVFFAVTLAVNAMGATGLINGLTQEEISNRYITLITPSPATFSIWGVIYSLLIIAMIAMIVKKDEPYYQSAIDQISNLFRVSSILNIAWIVSFSYVLVEISVLFILGFVITLALISQRLLRIHQPKRWLLPASFGMYGGWLFVATVVNIAAALVKMNWSGFGLSQETWGIIMLIVAVLLLIVILTNLKNAVFPLPVAWAYFGIYQFLKSPDGFNGEFTNLQFVALVGSIVLVAVALYQLYHNKFSVLPETDTIN